MSIITWCGTCPKAWIYLTHPCYRELIERWRLAKSSVHDTEEDLLLLVWPAWNFLLVQRVTLATRHDPVTSCDVSLTPTVFSLCAPAPQCRSVLFPCVGAPAFLPVWVCDFIDRLWPARLCLCLPPLYPCLIWPSTCVRLFCIKWTQILLESSSWVCFWV